jgi:hypothetical protein
MGLFVLKHAKFLFFVFVALAFIAAFSSVYYLGTRAAREAALENSITVLKQRAENDQNAQSLDFDGVCRELGGVPKDGKCM